jgi:hypothetical protein
MTPSMDGEKDSSTNYIGVIIGVLVIPVFFVFRHFGDPDRGLIATVYAGVLVLAIGICWDLKKRTWFWLLIALLIGVHVLLIFKLGLPFKYPNRMSFLAIGSVDLFFDIGIVRFVQKFIMREVSENDDQPMGTERDLRQRPSTSVEL